MTNKKDYQNLTKSELIHNIEVLQKKNDSLEEEYSEIIDFYLNARTLLAKALRLIRDLNKEINNL